MIVDIIYHTPSQTSLLESMNEHFYELEAIDRETYTLGDFDINLSLNNKHVLEKCWTPILNIIPYAVLF